MNGQKHSAAGPQKPTAFQQKPVLFGSAVTQKTTVTQQKMTSQEPAVPPKAAARPEEAAHSAPPALEYGLIGAKLGHSYSKPIHQQLGGYRYELCPLPTEAEARAFLERRAFRGINVTVPYKQLIIPYCDELDERAKAIGAVNTVVNRGGRLYGYNTDFSGMEYLLASLGVSLAGRTLLILGTGGTCRTALAVAKSGGAKRVLVASRSPAGGAGLPGDVRVVSYQEAARHPEVEVLINTSPAGMYPAVGECLVDLAAFPNLCAVADVIYNPFKTELILRAEERGIPAESGFGMLVAQAVYAAEHFMDKKLDAAVIPHIAAQLKAEIANLSLVGMPSSGKTSVGRQLAKRLGKTFVDLDTEIVRAAGMPIPQIFAQQGEAGFRRIEAEVTARFAKEHGQVISCGGGIVKTPGNARALRQNGPVLFLDRPLSQLSVGGGRPLSKSREALAQMETERRPLYMAAADAVVPNNTTFNAAVRAAMEAFYEAIDPQRTQS